MSETKRKAFIIIVLILVVLFGVGQFFSYSNLNPQAQNPSGSNSNPLATQVISYVPPTPATSTPIESGSCFASSVAAPYRTDAFRCSVGNAISDPCFVLPAGEETVSSSLPQLMCGENPAGTDTSSTFLLKLAKALPAASVSSGTAPTDWGWLVELNDGTICSPFTGTRPFDATGDVATYACNSALPGETMIFNDLNNSTGTWTAEVGSLSTDTAIFPPAMTASATVPVFAVWQ